MLRDVLVVQQSFVDLPEAVRTSPSVHMVDQKDNSYCENSKDSTNHVLCNFSATETPYSAEIKSIPG